MDGPAEGFPRKTALFRGVSLCSLACTLSPSQTFIKCFAPVPSADPGGNQVLGDPSVPVSQGKPWVMGDVCEDAAPLAAC